MTKKINAEVLPFDINSNFIDNYFEISRKDFKRSGVAVERI